MTLLCESFVNKVFGKQTKFKIFLCFYDADVEKIILKHKIHCRINFTNTQEVLFLKEKKI